MLNREYLLDANIIIKIWNKCPKLLDEIENCSNLHFKISQDIAIELSQKEFASFNGIPVLSKKFLKIIDHVVQEPSLDKNLFSNKSVKIIYNDKTKVYNVDQFKVSKSDFNLICICNKYESYSLVTEDKKLVSCAIKIIDPSRVLSFENFINEVKSYCNLN